MKSFSITAVVALGLGLACEASTGRMPPNLAAEPSLKGAWGYGVETSRGKDTPSGHWEIAGVPVAFDWGYFPNTIPAFPEELTAAKHFTWCRNRRAIFLMLFAGLRISEAAALRWRDVDLEGRYLVVRDGKGGKDRSVPLHPILLAELNKAPAHRPNWAVAGKADGSCMTVKSMAHIFERWLPERGLTISAHQLCHSFATELLRKRADIREIQELLGHNSSRTTEIYTHVSTKSLQQIKSPFDDL